MVAEQALSLIPGTHTKEESVLESCPLTSLYAYACAFSFRRTKTSKCVFNAHLQEDQDLNEVVLSPPWAGFDGGSPQKEISGSLKLNLYQWQDPSSLLLAFLETGRNSRVA